MINRLIEWSLRNRFIVACATLLIIALGVHAVFKTPVDAIPDLSENQVIVLPIGPDGARRKLRIKLRIRSR